MMSKIARIASPRGQIQYHFDLGSNEVIFFYNSIIFQKKIRVVMWSSFNYYIVLKSEYNNFFNYQILILILMEDKFHVKNQALALRTLSF
jgi:hypothetical protein